MAEISFRQAILWCYLIWYLVTIRFYFDPSPKLWINSLGISGVIGTGLWLSVSPQQNSKAVKPDRWQIFRLYLMPFCVSSFSALIKDQGFIVILSPRQGELLITLACCGLFLLLVYGIKFLRKSV
ncbi:MAG: hypothetical protein NW237_12675 [Cyanobacteriota bacterium]|nr:hypothetical protein [Cyanobacteriota bacterium]